MPKAFPQTSAVRPRRWRKIALRLGAAAIFGAIAMTIAAPWLLGWIIGHKLKTELASRMNAKLEFSRVRYQYPYGVRIENSHLLMPGTPSGPASWVDIGRLELTLAKLPLGKGAVLIQKLEIDSPTVHLSNASTSANPAAPTSPPVSSLSPPQKLSDLFELHHVKIADGRFEYDLSLPGHQIPPIIWGHLDAEINTLPASKSRYNFAVAVKDAPLAVAHATGSFDIDSLQLNIDKLNVVIACQPAERPAQIPSEGIAAIEKYQLGGEMMVDGSGQIPLQALDHSRYTATVTTKNIHAQPMGWASPLSPTQCTISVENSDSACRFELLARDGKLASVTASGAVDLRTLVLDLNKLAVDVECDANHPTGQLPAAMADAMSKLRAGGHLTLDSVAKIPLLAPLRSVYAAHMTLRGGHCQPAGWTGPVSPAQFSITCSNLFDPSNPPATAPVETQLPTQLPEAPQPACLWVNHLSALCGNQIFRIDSGQIIFDPRDNSWTARKFHGTTDIGDGPGPLKGDSTRIMLPFIASGEGKLGDPASNLRVALDEGSAVMTANHIHINRINGLLTATPTGLKSSGLIATCAEGQIKSIVNLSWSLPEQQPSLALTYNAETQIKQLDLHQLAMQYTTDPAVRQQAFGQLNLNLKCNGSILTDSPPGGENSIADRLNAQGDFDITNGYFVDIPVLKDVVSAMHSNAATVGEIAATFDIAHQVVDVSRIGANSPALGISGNGTIGFDQSVNMIFVATPLADWGKDVRNAGLLDQAGAAIIGKVQDVVNGLQRAIYQFRVTGHITPKPDVSPVVIPFLSDKMAPLFQKMAGNQQQGSLGDELKKQRSESGN